MQLRPAGESGEREPVLGGGESVELRRTGGASVGRSDSVSGIVRGQRTSQEGWREEWSPTLAPALAALGARGYRAAQLEAGIASGRLQLAARALGLGGTGLTFFDDEVSRLFATDAAPMTAAAVGVPAHRSAPGRQPRDPRLRVEDGPR